ncbi:hypothetical protein KIPB_011803, partial [Kipferlia bialata]|eukprot:g11803.t1
MSSVAELSSEVDAIRSKLSRYELLISRHEREDKEKDKSIREMRDKHSKEVQNLLKEHKERLSEAVSTVKSRLERQLAEMTAERNGCNDDAKKYKKKSTDLDVKLRTTSAKLKKAHELEQTMQARIAELEGEGKTKSGQAASMQAKIHKMKDVIAELEGVKAQLEAQCAQLTEALMQ